MTPRQRYLMRRQRRQTAVFSITGLSLAVVALVGVLVLIGVIPVPFGNSFSESVKYAEEGDLVCPSVGAYPTPVEDVNVKVVNTTAHQGLATDATEMLISAGFTPQDPDNSTTEYGGKARIFAGISGVDDAYTVARYFPGAKVVLTAATDKAVTVELGSFYDSPIDAEEVAHISRSKDPLVRPEGCLPVPPNGLQSGDEPS